MLEKHGSPLAVGADMYGRHSDDRAQPECIIAGRPAPLPRCRHSTGAPERLQSAFSRHHPPAGWCAVAPDRDAFSTEFKVRSMPPPLVRQCPLKPRARFQRSADLSQSSACGSIKLHHLKPLLYLRNLHRHLIPLELAQHGLAQWGFDADDLHDLIAADQLHAAANRPKKEVLLLAV